ncbi:MAG: thioredoxin family protein [Halobacteriota archaeon]
MSAPESQTSEPVHVSSEKQLRDLISDATVALVDFHADWCGPCKMLEPVVEEIAAETDTLVLKVDIDELQALARSEGVRSVPTLKFYADGEHEETVVGVRGKDDLLGIVDRIA